MYPYRDVVVSWGEGALYDAGAGAAAGSSALPSSVSAGSLGAAPPSAGASAARTGSGLSDEVHSVRLSRRSCMMSVLSRYDSSDNESSSAMASSKACFARWQARSGELRIS